MPRLILIEPDLADYWYEQKLLSDPDTMNYNAGYDVSYFGYYYDTGCIDFPKERWLDDYHKRKNNPQKYFALIKDLDLDKYIGYANYHYNLADNRYWCGIVIEGKYRGQGYAKEALKLLCRQAFEHGIDCLYDNFEKNRIAALRVFQEVGFKIIEEKLWLKFAKHVDGVVVSLHKKDFEEIIKKV